MRMPDEMERLIGGHVGEGFFSRITDTFSGIRPLCLALFDVRGKLVWTKSGLPGNLHDVPLRMSPDDLAQLLHRAQTARGAVETKDELGNTVHLAPILLEEEPAGSLLGLWNPIETSWNEHVSLGTLIDSLAHSLSEVLEAKQSASSITAQLAEAYEELSLVYTLTETLDISRSQEESLKVICSTVSETRREDLRMVAEAAEGARVINLVNLVFLRAINEGASDIHIEPDVQSTRVRYRIDGTLQETMNPKGDLHSAIVSRIKVMAKMDIAERRLPQDGRMHVVAEGKDVDMRVSSMPTVLGEKIVIRLLDKGKLTLDINRIGFHAGVLGEIKGLLKRPHGIILVTGPTGSGKTTTLYCGLSLISSIERNVVTIEDPVEYQLPLVNQIQTNHDHGLTFAKILRSVLRQDPDIVMVGEIRDKETAEVSIQAALTGHLVLSTLHTNESAGAIARLVEMGIQPFLLTSSIVGVLAQRLVRTVCSNCKTSYFPPRELLERIGWRGKNTSFVTGRGCEKCFDSGLRGRVGIFELLVMDDAMRENVLRDSSAHAIRGACLQSGMRMLKDEAFRLVEEGKTSLEEVMRVVFVEEVADEADPGSVDPGSVDAVPALAKTGT